MIMSGSRAVFSAYLNLVTWKQILFTKRNTDGCLSRQLALEEPTVTQPLLFPVSARSPQAFSTAMIRTPENNLSTSLKCL